MKTFSQLLLFYCLLFLSSIGTTIVHAQEVDPDRVAVIQLKNQAELSKQEMTYLSDLLRQVISNNLPSQYIVLTKENILALLPPDRSIEDCVGECEIETGRLLSAQYIVSGDVFNFGGRLRVNIRLHNTETGQLLGSEVAKGKELLDLESSVSQVGKALIQHLDPSSLAQNQTENIRRKIGGGSSFQMNESQLLIVSFTSSPIGAAVVVDGVQHCSENQKECRVELTEGSHQVSLSLKDYFIHQERITVSKSQKAFQWTLKPNFVALNLTSTPSRLSVKVGNQVVKTPYNGRLKPNRLYKIVANDRCYQEEGEEVVL